MKAIILLTVGLFMTSCSNNPSIGTGTQQTDSGFESPDTSNINTNQGFETDLDHYTISQFFELSEVNDHSTTLTLPLEVSSLDNFTLQGTTESAIITQISQDQIQYQIKSGSLAALPQDVANFSVSDSIQAFTTLDSGAVKTILISVINGNLINPNYSTGSTGNIPTDSDGDGILDEFDDCPDVTGLASFNGCPDPNGGVQVSNFCGANLFEGDTIAEKRYTKVISSNCDDYSKTFTLVCELNNEGTQLELFPTEDDYSLYPFEMCVNDPNHPDTHAQAAQIIQHNEVVTHKIEVFSFQKFSNHSAEKIKNIWIPISEMTTLDIQDYEITSVSCVGRFQFQDVNVHAEIDSSKKMFQFTSVDRSHFGKFDPTIKFKCQAELVNPDNGAIIKTSNLNPLEVVFK